MNRCAIAAVALAAGFGCATTGVAQAADLAEPAPAVEAAVPSLFDVAFGVAGVTDYRFRGVTNSKKDPAIQGYVELQTDWLYAGVWSSSVNFPRPLSDPSAEIDLYGGLRHTWGAFTLDVGYLYYWYPGEAKAFNGVKIRETDYWEIKALPSIAIGDLGSITANIWWSSDYANTGANELYLSIVPKVNIPVAAFPNLGFYVSGEFGKQWIKRTTDLNANYNPHDFLTWNVGGGVTYKAMTLDVRYVDTDLNKKECALNTGVRGWCGSTVVGKIAFDTSLNKLK
ncbi:hypothetical protein IHQ68_06235 [Chelatococcus sambhunathii]|uniref:Uncharacterized protein n=1 Tax=Chelatococcus sambhunathii TaxID=363953 RepID=A0ABU1DE43_9HYPH|nr:TorF family putative porin [Chelatococcus sambhunathii]MDR4306215.1 hypothetical protein [Chelatococcus sambhunathii]